MTTDSDTTSDISRRLRYQIYGLLILLSLGSLVGRVLTVKSHYGFTPMLSANDRSRWCTIRALVDNGTFVIDPIIQQQINIQGFEKPYRNWSTIDRVRHRGFDGLEHYYSSKPPLYPALLAWEYWLLKKVTGRSIGEHPFFIMRSILLMTHVPMLLLYFLAVIGMVERLSNNDRTKILIVSLATFGTFVTTFGVTLNNHLPAAVSAMLVIYALTIIWRDETTAWYAYLVAGFAAAFTAANELPALAFFVSITLALLYKSWWRTLAYYVPAALLVTISFFHTNYIAHGSWRPPYMHRHDGELITSVRPISEDLLRPQDDSPQDDSHHAAAARSLLHYEIPVPVELRVVFAEKDLELSDQALLAPRPKPNSWYIWDRIGNDRYALELVGDGLLEIRKWGNWYDYRGSYWTYGERKGVDAGEPARLKYSFNMLFGTYGVFSLTPALLPFWFGLYLFFKTPEYRMRGFATMVLGLTLLCFAFYVARPVIDRNYGGVSCCLRWLMWFTPMWLVCLVPAYDRIVERKYGFAILAAMVGLSVVSASFGAANPWQHPWIYQLASSLSGGG